MELYDILKNKRETLGTFLLQNCNYEYLKSQLIQIENTKIQKERHILMTLLLGERGLESNKQKAIYELPTNELITIICVIVEHIKVKDIEEFAAGLGLLSYMLKGYLDDEYNITATDGNNWMETKSNTCYYQVEEKLILKYCLDNTNFDNKLIIVSWPPESDDLKRVITHKRPKYIIIIGDKYCNYNKKIVDHLINNNYQVTNIPAKQISCHDYFLLNKGVIDNTSRSSITFAVCDPAVSIRDLLLKIKFQYDGCLHNKMSYTKEIYLQDAYYYKFFEENMLNIIENNPTGIDRIVAIFNGSITKKKIIPKFVNTLAELEFWWQKILINAFPNISKRNKFKEYYECSLILESSNGIELLKQNEKIPNWVNSLEDARKCLYYEFTFERKSWKISELSFRNFDPLNNVQLIPPNSLRNIALISDQIQM